MTRQHSSEFWFSTKVEATDKYASGDGGATAGAMTKMSTSGTAASKPASQPIMPIKKYKREVVKSMGDSDLDQVVYTSGLEETEGEIEYYLQDKTWLTQLLQASAGNIPSLSRTIHWQHGKLASATPRRFESYGCLCTEWKLHVEPNILPTQALKIKCYQSKSDTRAGTNVTAFDKLAFDSTQPATSKDISLSIDATPIVFNTLDVTIKTEYDWNSDISDYATLEPRVISRDITIDFEYKDVLDSLIIHQLTLSPSDIDVVITIGSPFSATLTMENMRVTEGDAETMPESVDIVNHKLSLGLGTGTTITLS